MKAAPLQLRAQAPRKEAEENAVSPQGAAYRQDVDQKLATYEQACVKQAPSESRKFDLLMLVSKDGSVQDAHTEQMRTPIGFCMMRVVFDFRVKKEALLSPPPHDSYWLILAVDPATIAAS